MAQERFVVVGAGEVGSHLARLLSQAGHSVVVIDQDAARAAALGETLDASVVCGNGAYLPVLEAAGVSEAELVMAVSSSDEANLAVSLLAKELGARRTVVRVQVAAEVVRHRRVYEAAFRADLLLSTQLLTTIRILDYVRGHRTIAVEYLAGGRIQLRKIQLDADSVLVRKPLKEVDLPQGTLVVAYFSGDKLRVPSGEDRAEAGDAALVLARSELIDDVERRVAARQETMGTVVLAGGGQTGYTVAEVLESFNADVKIIESSRRRAHELAARFPRFEVLCGDATDAAMLRAERIGHAAAFVALSGRDDANLMACLLAQELGVGRVVALVQRSETLRLWQRLGVLQVVSPRALAYERVREYIENGYNAHIVSLQRGAAVVERRLYAASPAAGATLAEINPPRGLIVGAVERGDRVFVPRGPDRLEIGDNVILFVKDDELDTVRLLFPGREEP